MGDGDEGWEPGRCRGVKVVGGGRWVGGVRKSLDCEEERAVCRFKGGWKFEDKDGRMTCLLFSSHPSLPPLSLYHLFPFDLNPSDLDFSDPKILTQI